MAQANLGVRVVLDDAASGGFNALGLGVGNLIGRIGNLAWAISMLPANLQGTAVATAGLGLAFEGLATATEDVIQAAMGLQDSMAQIQVNVKGASDVVSQLTTTINNLADYSVYSSQQVADGFVLMGQKGFDAAQIIEGDMGKAMVDLAESINTGPVPAATLLSSAMRIWNADASKSMEYANMLSFAFHNGVPDVNALTLAIQQAGAQAVQLGIPFSEFVTTLDLLGQRGLTATQAALSLKNVFIALSDPTTKTQKELADLGVITINDAVPGLQALVEQVNSVNKHPIQLDGTLTSLNQLYTQAQKLDLLHTDKDFYQWALSIGALNNNMFDANGNFKDFNDIINLLGGSLDKLATPEATAAAIENIFNRTALKGGQILFDNKNLTDSQAQSLQRLLEQYVKNNGVQKDANTITSTASAHLKELGSTIHSAAAQMGQIFLPVLGDVASKLNNFLNNLRVHHPDLLRFMGVVLMIATALAGLGTIVGSAILFFTLFGEVLGAVAGPALVVTGVIAGLVAIFALLATHGKQVREVLSPLGDLFGKIAQFVGDVLNPVLTQLGNQWHELGQIVGPELKKSLGELKRSFDDIGQTIRENKQLWDALEPAVMGVATVIGGTLVGALALATGLINGLTHALAFMLMGLSMVAKGIGQFISGALNFFITGWNTTLRIIKALLTGHFNDIPKILHDALPKLGKAFKDMIQGLGNIIKGAFLGTAGAIGAGIWGAFTGAFGVFGNVIHRVTGLGGDVINGLLTGLGNAGGKVSQWFNNLWKDAIAKIKSWLGIQSPSTVFADIGVQVIQGLINGLNRLVGAVPTLLVNLGKQMLQAMADLPGKFVDLAGHIIDGFGNKLKDGFGKITSGIGGLKDKFVDGWKHGFGILSPSRVMAEIGQFVSQGMVVGIQSVDVGGEAQKHFLKVVPDKHMFTTPQLQAMHAQHSAQAYAHNAAAHGGDIIVTVPVDGKAIAQVTLDRFTGRLKSQGIGRKLR